MTNPRDYPDVIDSAESGRPLQRGVKALTITVDGQPFSYGQPGWWASLEDPDDKEGQLTDEDNLVRAAARREAMTGFFAELTDDQKRRALAYRGPDYHGDMEVHAEFDTLLENRPRRFKK